MVLDSRRGSDTSGDSISNDFRKVKNFFVIFDVMESHGLNVACKGVPQYDMYRNYV